MMAVVGKHLRKRFRIPIIASGEGASVEMVLVGEPVDVLIAEIHCQPCQLRYSV